VHDEPEAPRGQGDAPLVLRLSVGLGRCLFANETYRLLELDVDGHDAASDGLTAWFSIPIGVLHGVAVIQARRIACHHGDVLGLSIDHVVLHSD
jgi:hypothetical protein